MKMSNSGFLYVSFAVALVSTFSTGCFGGIISRSALSDSFNGFTPNGLHNNMTNDPVLLWIPGFIFPHSNGDNEMNTMKEMQMALLSEFDMEGLGPLILGSQLHGDGATKETLQLNSPSFHGKTITSTNKANKKVSQPKQSSRVDKKKKTNKNGSKTITNKGNTVSSEAAKPKRRTKSHPTTSRKDSKKRTRRPHTNKHKQRSKKVSKQDKIKKRGRSKPKSSKVKMQRKVQHSSLSDKKTFPSGEMMKNLRYQPRVSAEEMEEFFRSVF